MQKEIKFPNLKGEMAKHGETQESIGKLLGHTRGTIGLKLNGKSDWTIEEVEKLCNYFNKDYYELFK